MFVEDRNGDLVNLDNCKTIELQYEYVEVYPSNSNVGITLFEDDDQDICSRYFDELKKELAAFGKLIQVKMD